MILFVLGFFIYLVLGGLVCYFVKANAGDCFVGNFDDDYSSPIAILTGIFWPVASPFTIAILFAKKKEGSK